MPAGSTSATMTINATINARTLGTLTNDARISSATFDSNNGNDLTQSTTNVVGSADVSVVLDSEASYKASSTVHYVMNVTNAGPSDASAVNAALTLPGAKIGDYQSNSANCPPPRRSGILKCAIGAMPAGSSVTIEVSFYVSGNKGTVTSSAAVTSATPDPLATNNTSVRSISPSKK